MSLRHALLGLLVEHPASGYDLLKTFGTSLANVWPATQSQIYGELTKLADSELIVVSEQGPRGRKEYTLTDTGLAELRRWLIETEPQRTRSDVLLRVFFLGVLTPQQARDYLDNQAAHATKLHEELKSLDGSIEWDDEDLSIYGRIALEYGQRFSAMQRDWAEWALTQVKDK
ncbi:PadR family transcriptional regulator [Kribbella qitaiheensis]|uniref:PadR family transcriptional regulator n=1 Tax=Kribbella qitaiheensis TaxID=1544730 RepID=A0A7G6X1Y4_9ACTN|nr:PadR family transcriptional regulator [Kribbella qitaiheensis]QNE20249.1 PadR family transcriptional regulator [Kribbella qitaiheensis]